MILVAALVVSDPVYYGSPVATAGRPVTSRVDTGHRDSGWLIPVSVCVWAYYPAVYDLSGVPPFARKEPLLFSSWISRCLVLLLRRFTQQHALQLQ